MYGQKIDLLTIKKRVMNKGTRNVLMGFIAGVATGALTGVLFAPEKGKVTREKMSKKVKSVSKDLTETMNEKIDKLKEQVNEIIHDMRGKDSDDKKAKEKPADKTKTTETKAKATAAK